MKYKYNGQWYDISVPSYDATPVGTIIPYAGATVPEGYLICNGQSLLRTDYADLFTVIGTTYGTGDGSTTFNLPNIKGRVLVGLDSTQTEFNALGKVGGSKELQAHHHDALSQLGIASDNGTTTGDINNITVSWQTNVKHFKVDQTIGTGDSGNLQPYIVVNYIIKAHPSAVNTSEVVNEHSTSETDVYSANQTNVEITSHIKTSNTTSNSDTYSCTYINTELNKTKWQTLGTIYNVGQSYALNIPSGAKELNIDCFYSMNDGVSINILTSNLSSNHKGYDGGYYKNNNDMLRVLIYATSSKVWVQELVLNGSSVSSITNGCTINYK